MMWIRPNRRVSPCMHHSQSAETVEMPPQAKLHLLTVWDTIKGIERVYLLWREQWSITASAMWIPAQAKLLLSRWEEPNKGKDEQREPGLLFKCFTLHMRMAGWLFKIFIECSILFNYTEEKLHYQCRRQHSQIVHNRQCRKFPKAGQEFLQCHAGCFPVTHRSTSKHWTLAHSLLFKIK